MNSMRSSARAISFLMRTLIHAAHASFAPFVLSERAIFSLSGHLYKISQQSHQSGPTLAVGADLSASIRINLSQRERQEAG